VYLEKGVIVHATINDLETLAPEKCVYRIITWRHGTFYMEPAEDGTLPTRVELSTEGALMEGLRIFDEVHRLDLPPMASHIALARPMTVKLRDLTPEQLDVLQVALEQTQLEAVFNNSPLDDIQIAQALAILIDNGYLKVTPGTET
jgi:hypothetical protein